MSRRFKDVLSSWNSQDEDSRNGFLLIAGISAVIILAIAVIGFGYYSERIASKNDPVLRVGDRKISYSQLETRLKYELTGVQNLSSEQFPAVVSSVMVSMQNEELVRRFAADKGITVSDEEVEAKIREQLNLSADASREAYASRLRRELLNNGLSLGEYKELARSLAIESKVRETLGSQVPAEGEQADLRILQLSERDDIVAAQQRLQNGETLGALAAQLSLHASADSAGEMGWTPRGALPAEVENFAFSAEPGTTSDIIETATDGFFIVEVRGKETRAVEEDAKETVVTYQLQKEVRALQESLGSEFLLTNGQLSDLATSISNYLAAGG